MRYYAIYENEKLIAIGTGFGGTEITEAQYNELLMVIREKADFVDKIYNGEISIDDVPVEWQTEIQRRVNELITADEEMPEPAEKDSEGLKGEEPV